MSRSRGSILRLFGVKSWTEADGKSIRRECDACKIDDCDLAKHRRIDDLKLTKYFKYTVLLKITGSLSSLCNPIGFLFGGFSMDMFGRKWSTQCTFLPFIAGWVIIHSSDSLCSIYVGVALHGVASGRSSVVVIVVF